MMTNMKTPGVAVVELPLPRRICLPSSLGGAGGFVPPRPRRPGAGGREGYWRRCAARAERRAAADRREAAEAGGALTRLQEQVAKMEARMGAMELKLQLQQHHEVVLRRDISATCRGATARLQAFIRRWQAQREVSRLEAIPVIQAAVMGWWVR